ncbi:hypothetical protein NUW54_g2292 [Trametes sanguinea]|uniref:Uncharacterized protein n=1 Tax=Trametes sanguinea TaxID=158606 RepID=A0ACC1Q5V9_9APHY|nr:hypothetical protein NUW54_g2292 [Trametes sanguinea]
MDGRFGLKEKTHTRRENMKMGRPGAATIGDLAQADEHGRLSPKESAVLIPYNMWAGPLMLSRSSLPHSLNPLLQGPRPIYPTLASSTCLTISQFSRISRSEIPMLTTKITGFACPGISTFTLKLALEERARASIWSHPDLVQDIHHLSHFLVSWAHQS